MGRRHAGDCLRRASDRNATDQVNGPAASTRPISADAMMPVASCLGDRIIACPRQIFRAGPAGCLPCSSSRMALSLSLSPQRMFLPISVGIAIARSSRTVDAVGQRRYDAAPAILLEQRVSQGELEHHRARLGRCACKVGAQARRRITGIRRTRQRIFKCGGDPQLVGQVPADQREFP